MTDLVKSLRIFISSPGDVNQERSITRAIIEQLQYDPYIRGKVTFEIIAWDQPGAGTPMLATMNPQEAINQGLPKPSECDIVVVIFWSRMGTPLPYPEYKKPDGSPYLSGTEWEYYDAFRSAKSSGTPLLVVYRRTEDVALTPRDPEFLSKYEQWKAVDAFFQGFNNPDGSIRQGHNRYEKPEDFRREFESHLKKLVHSFVKDVPSSVQSLPAVWTGSPFPGLRAFTQKDAPIFFGRGREVDALIEKMASSHFVGVVGASGSGKSSLVGAGLLPRLKDNAISGPSVGSQYWLPVVFRPGADPFDAVAGALLSQLRGKEISVSEYADQRKKLASALLNNPAMLMDTCVFALKDQPEWSEILFFIDQFEELFTMTAESLIEPFVSLLEGIVASDRIRTVVTLRADFYHRCVEIAPLAALFDSGQYPLSAPGSGALYAMITKPAELAALEFDEGLPHRILEDTGNEPGALALMAYALDELYNACKDRKKLTHTAYETLGGVQGAIGKRAENTFNTVSQDSQEQLSFVFRELIEVDERGTVTRRRVLYSVVVRNAPAELLVNALTNARLLVQTQQDGQPVVEVAHEALLHNWDRLRLWIESVQDKLYLLRQVRSAASEWDRSGRRPDYLWSHERLEPIYEMQNILRVELSPVVEAFIRPEGERLVKEYWQSAAKSFRKQAIIDRIIELGASGVPFLLDIMASEPAWSGNLDQIQEGLRRFPDAAVPKLNALLTGEKTTEVRARAAAALGVIGDRRAVPALLNALSVPEDEYSYPSAQAAIAEALGRIGDSSVLPTLITAAQTGSPNGRAEAVKALGLYQDQSTIPALMTALKDGSDTVRENAVEAFAAMGAPDSAVVLMDLLRDPSISVRQQTLRALGKLGDKRAIPSVTDVLLKDPEQSVVYNARSIAADVLGVLGDDSTVPVLLQALKDNKDFVRISAIKALTRLGNEQVVAALSALVSSPEEEERKAAIQALGVIGSSAAVPTLLEALRDPDTDVCSVVIRALLEIGDQRCVPNLIQCLYSDDYFVHLEAENTLRVLANTDAVPALLELITDGNEAARSGATTVLQGLADLTVLDSLAELLDDEREEVRDAASSVINSVLGKQPVSATTSLLASKNPHIRASATLAFGAVAEQNDIPLLLKLLDDSDPDVCTAAVSALARIEDEQLVSHVIHLLDSTDPTIRAAVIYVLADAGAVQCIPRFVEMLDSEEERIRFAAVDALGKIGDQSVIPSLHTLLDDEDESLQQAVLRALFRMGDESIVPQLIEGTHLFDGPAANAMMEAMSASEDESLQLRFLQFLDSDLPETVRLAAADWLRNADTSVLRTLVQAIPSTGDVATTQVVEVLKTANTEAFIDFIAFADSSFSEAARKAAVGRLQGADAEFAVRTCVQILPLQEGWERDDTLKSMTWLLTPELLWLVRPLLEHDSLELRMTGAKLLASFGDESGLPIIISCLTSDDNSVRDAAFSAASSIQHPLIDAKIIELIDHPDIWVSSSALAAITDTSAFSEIPLMVKIVQRGEVIKSGAAAQTLGRLRVKEALPYLIAVLSTPDAPFSSLPRSQLVEALGEIGDEAAVPVLIRALRDPERDVRLKAALALEKVGTAEAQVALAKKQSLLLYGHLDDTP